MAITNGPHLGLIEDSPAGEIAPNDWRRMLRALDALLFFSVLSATTTAQPGSPTNGDRYIIPAGATGTDWAGKAAGTIGIYTTRYTITTGGSETTTAVWEFFTPKRNWIAFVEDASDSFLRYTGTTWTGALRAAEGFEIPAGKVLTVNSVQVITAQQAGLGASLSSMTATGTYGANEQTMLQQAHDKIRLLEVIIRAHGLGTT